LNVGTRLLLISLSVISAALSAFAGYVQWLAAGTGEAARLEAAIQWQRRLGMPWAESAIQLAALRPADEAALLREAALDGDAPAGALVRLALLEEMAGNEREGRDWMQRALAKSKSYKVFLAAAGQAARRGDEEDLLRWAAEALRYCPGEPDAVFQLLMRAPRGEEVLRLAGPRRREDYLRFLIGQEKYLQALEYQGALEASEKVIEYRRELAERLILNQHWEEALRLHPDPKRGGVQNARFEAEPTSLAYDWRLAKHEAVRVDWRPGQLRVELGELRGAKELLSQYVKHSGPDLPRLSARWSGSLRGLSWKQERLHPEWVRVALVAEAGHARAFSLEEVRVNGDGG
jgi:tetratricopeptide (TPR) repeat protein